jgi:hypothetical protein
LRITFLATHLRTAFFTTRLRRPSDDAPANGPLQTRLRIASGDAPTNGLLHDACGRPSDDADERL